jgi:hypothetical protein
MRITPLFLLLPALAPLLTPITAQAQVPARATGRPPLILEGGAEWLTEGPRALIAVRYPGFRRDESRWVEVRAAVAAGAGPDGLGVRWIDLEIRPYARPFSLGAGGDPILLHALPLSIERDLALGLEGAISLRLVGIEVGRESARAFARLALSAAGVRVWESLEARTEAGLFAYGAEAEIGRTYALGDVARVRVTYVGGEIAMGRLLTASAYSRAAVEFHRLLAGYVEAGWRGADFGAFAPAADENARRYRRTTSGYLRVGVEARWP